jgi:alanyl aminopeptidase
VRDILASMVPPSRLAVLCAAAAAAATLTACSGSSSTRPVTPPPGPDPTSTSTTSTGPAGTPALSPPPDGIRLPAGARPLSYRVALDADPAKPTFRGTVTIEVELTAPQHPLWLNAETLTIDAARLRRDGGAAQPLTVVPGPLGVIGLVAAAPIAAGKVTLELEFAGVQEEKSTSGVLRREANGEHYLLTQFESLGARRAFPCFDEPGFKVPWTFELTVPAGLVAAANAPIEHEETLADGRRHVRFAVTPPLPSYLIAFAVGPFDVVDAGKTRGGAPMRVLVPRGDGPDAAFMAAQSAPIVAALEDYTGVPYPYAKLDHVVIPGNWGGAMENAGLITYSRRLLVVPASETAWMRAAGIATMAHEVAHHWFGDLVTLAWWDDIWLNEAMATWADSRLMAQLHPELGGADAPLTTRRAALLSEADPSARAVRQPIVEKLDIDRAFDGITYQKGATVLRMFEEALGPDKFRAGIQAYLRAHAHGNATAADLMAALAAQTGVDVAAQMAPWLDQAGAPVVEVALECPGGGKPAALTLRQHRYRAPSTTGATVESAPSNWHIPLCVRIAGENQPRCIAMSEPTARLELGARCPTTVIPSASGQYITAPSAPLRKALLASWKSLTRAEQIAVAGDTTALVEAHELGLGAQLELLPQLTASGNAELLRIARNTVFSAFAAVAPADRKALSALVKKAFAKPAARLGWRPRAGESYADAAGRIDVMTTYVEFAGDVHMSRATLALAGAWLKDHDTLPRTMASRFLRTAIRVDTDGALFEAILAALPGETDLEVRRVLANALGETTDPARLVRALEQVVAHPEHLPDDISVFWGADDLDTSTARITYLRDHLAAIIPLLPFDFRTYLAPDTCQPTLRPAVVAILDTHFVPMEEFGASSRARTLARVDQCIAHNATLAAALGAYFKSR